MYLYRKIQAAGKIVTFTAAPENIEPIVRGLDPSLLCITARCKTPAEADDLIASTERWACARSR